MSFASHRRLYVETMAQPGTNDSRPAPRPATLGSALVTTRVSPSSEGLSEPGRTAKLSWWIHRRPRPTPVTRRSDGRHASQLGPRVPHRSTALPAGRELEAADLAGDSPAGQST